MTDREIGFGIVGCGMIAENHAKAIRDSRGGRLAGVVSRSANRARAFAEKFGAPFFTDRLEALLERDDVHALCVTTPSGAHLEPAAAAAAAGKHVLVEKPLEVNVERVDRMIEACRLHGVKLAAVFQARFGPGAQTVKRAVEAGRLGRRTLSSAYVKWYRTPQYYAEGGWKGTLRWDGGGALMNQAIHAVDLLQWLAGMPRRVAAFAGTLAHTGIEVEDTAAAALEFPDGSFGTVEASTAAWPGFARRFELSGDRGSIVLEDDRIVRWEFAEGRPEDGEIREKFGRTSLLKSGAGDPRAINHLGHGFQVQDLIDAIREDRPARVSGEEGRNAVALIEAIYRSARENAPAEPAAPASIS